MSDDYRDDVGAFLLGALDEAEAEAFEAHLADCPDCLRQLELLRPAADALPRAVEPAEPPARLKASLMQTVEREAREQRPAPERRPLGERLRTRLPSWRVRPALALAGACLFLLVGGLAGFGLSRVAEDSDRTVAAQVNSTDMATVSGSLEVFDGGDGAILRLREVPRPAGGRVYQAWIKRGDAVLPQPTFEVNHDGSASAPIADSLEGADAVLVTRERRGGAGEPSEDPIVTVPL